MINKFDFAKVIIDIVFWHLSLFLLIITDTSLIFISKF